MKSLCSHMFFYYGITSTVFQLRLIIFILQFSPQIQVTTHVHQEWWILFIESNKSCSLIVTNHLRQEQKISCIKSDYIHPSRVTKYVPQERRITLITSKELHSSRVTIYFHHRKLTIFYCCEYALLLNERSHHFKISI